ncbi:MAG: hypothetical protein Tsb0020_21700 [Haliangiales bacterium]
MTVCTYWPTRVLGQGGHGVVCAGELRGEFGLPTPIALKIMHQSGRLDPERLAQFVREARIGARYSKHEHVVGTLSSGYLTDQRPYIVFERQAVTLEYGFELLADDASAIRAVALGVLAGLQHLHSHDIEHLDVHAGNVFIGYDGVVRLGDFGNAQRGFWSRSDSKTNAPSPFNPDSPPISDAKRARLARSADHLALARLLCRMLTLRAPRRPDADMFDPSVAADSLPDDTPPDLIAVIAALTQTPNERPSLADAIQILTDSGAPIASRAAMYELKRRVASELPERCEHDSLLLTHESDLGATGGQRAFTQRAFTELSHIDTPRALADPRRLDPAPPRPSADARPPSREQRPPRRPDRGVEKTAPPSAHSQRPARQRRRLLIAAAALCAIAGLWTVTSPRPPTPQPTQPLRARDAAAPAPARPDEHSATSRDRDNVAHSQRPDRDLLTHPTDRGAVERHPRKHRAPRRHAQPDARRRAQPTAPRQTRHKMFRAPEIGSASF